MTNDQDCYLCICRLSQLFEISQQLEALADSIPSNSPLPQVLYDGADDDYYYLGLLLFPLIPFISTIFGTHEIIKLHKNDPWWLKN